MRVGALEEQRLQHQGPWRLLEATPTCSDVPRAEQSDSLRFVFLKEAWAHDPCILKRQPQFPHLLSGDNNRPYLTRLQIKCVTTREALRIVPGA